MSASGNDYGSFRMYVYTIGCHVSLAVSATLHVPVINSSDNEYVLAYVHVQSAV